jgi:hypothetical protein
VKEPQAVTHIWVKPLTPIEEALCRLITERYEGPNGEALQPEETPALVVLRVPDIRRKRQALGMAS